MEVALINLYKKVPIHFNKVSKLLQSTGYNIICLDDYVEVKTTKAYADALALKEKISSQYDAKEFVKIADQLYKLVVDSDTKAFVLPIDDWMILKAIKKSYLQLTDKHVLFILPDFKNVDLNSFLKCIRYLERFRNIHIAIANKSYNSNTLPKMYNLHFLEDEDIGLILRLHINNKRKYIGWRYSLNELRQKIKFHKDLAKVFLLSRYHNPYKQKLNHKEKIPKVIHYCWFGGKPMPADVQRYVDTWQKVAPDYKLKCWSEENFPFEKYPFAKEALVNKKWAFIADVARLHALYFEGGIYLDTDIELLKNFDEFLDEDGFTSYESLNLIAMAAIGFKKYHPWIAEMLLWYSCVHCDDDYTEIANTKIVSKITKMKYKVQLDGNEKLLSCGLHIYPRDYFSPKLEKNKWLTTDNTHCIHHFTGMW